MRWKETIIGVTAGVLVLTGCGQDQQPAPAESPPASQELTRMPGRKPAQPSPEEGRQVPAAQLDTTGLPEGYPTDVRAEGSTLVITGQEGGCSKAGADVEQQRGDRVTVTMTETKPADKNVMCTMDMRYPPITVRLDEPLGDRLLVLEYERRTH